jgi:hypothetical protein
VVLADSGCDAASMNAYSMNAYSKELRVLAAIDRGSGARTVGAYCSGLERLGPHACIEGRVFVGYVDEHGEEREVSYACNRCADSSRGR